MSETNQTELLPCVTMEPTQPAQASVIWMHGLGADGHDFEPIVPHLHPHLPRPTRFLFPNAPVMPVSINGGYPMPAWYDIRDADLSQREDEAGVRKSATQIAAIINRQIDQGIPAKRIVLAGFSQGGAIALHLGLRFEQQLAGIMALSTYLTVPDKLSDERSAANQSTAIMMAHGEQDPVVPITRGEFSRDHLEQLGYAVEWQPYPMQHAVCPEEIADIGRWLGQRLR